MKLARALPSEGSREDVFPGILSGRNDKVISIADKSASTGGRAPAGPAVRRALAM